MNGIDPKWVFWLGILVTIETAIGQGTVKLTSLYPVPPYEPEGGYALDQISFRHEMCLRAGSGGGCKLIELIRVNSCVSRA